MRYLIRAGALAALVLAATTNGASAQAVFKGTWAGPPANAGPIAVTPPPPGAAPVSPVPPGMRSPSPKHVLVLGGARGWHHDSIPAGMAAVYDWGRATHLWDTEMRTEFSLVNGRGGQPMTAGFQPVGLRDFDAIVVVSATGDWGLDAAQKTALLDFVRAGGGLVAIHGGVDANLGWKDYVDMVGGVFVSHPFNNHEWPLFPFPLRTENRDTPMTSFLPARWIRQDELYVVKNFSRADTEVLLSIDAERLDMTRIPDQLPPDRDLPVAWIKQYGKGRVFASTIGHAKEAFDDPDVARMYTEAIRWALRLSGDDARPHPALVPPFTGPRPGVPTTNVR
jgi:type 1 glutamine amidotransferase